MKPWIPVGFDYSRALLRIRGQQTYEQVAEFCGFAGKSVVSKIVNDGHIPTHPQGEAIWALYVQLFGEKPPMAGEQARGANVSLRKRRNGVSAV